ncbi:hypothetical protein K438DRAFT_1790296 [Mycena galopus ATCC 62051]|nr:hypothetical protein K438DRAFT_1790296 [Mycena galopus ATCC 62051]
MLSFLALSLTLLLGLLVMASNPDSRTWAVLRIPAESDAADVERTTGWKLFLRIRLSPPVIGKTVDRVITKAVDALANRRGLGPRPIAARIEACIGTGEEQYRMLCETRRNIPVALEDLCAELIKFTRCDPEHIPPFEIYERRALRNPSYFKALAGRQEPSTLKMGVLADAGRNLFGGYEHCGYSGESSD